VKASSKKLLLSNTAVILAALGLYLFLSNSASINGLLEKGYDRRIHAKEFSLPVIGAEPGDAGVITLTGLKGEPAVISFWASWCSVCKSELPELAEISRKLASLHLKPILAVASYDDAVNVRGTERFRSGQFRIVLDKNGDVAQLWKVRALPHTVVLDGEGVVRLSHSGVLSAARVEEIRTLLASMRGKTSH
jgi:thiol-disulfide isomerase/thioredoxin